MFVGGGCKVEEEFQKAVESGAPVAGVIVEPIQAEGGKWWLIVGVVLVMSLL